MVVSEYDLRDLTKEKDRQLLYHSIHPWAVPALLPPALLRQYPQLVCEIGVGGSCWTLSCDNIGCGCGGNKVIKRDPSGENLCQRVRLSGTE